MKERLIKLYNRTAAIAFLLLFSNALILTNIQVLPIYIDAAFYMIGFFTFIVINIGPIKHHKKSRLTAMYNGRELLIYFMITFSANSLINTLFAAYLAHNTASIVLLVLNILICLLIDIVLCINGAVRLFVTSTQLGLKWRVITLAFWWIPVVNIVLFTKICTIARCEYEFETAKKELDETRAESEICKTKYPLLLVHGVFFRDLKLINYWGRIPKELKRNGSSIYYGNQQSAASVKDSATELKERILQIVEETGCEKLNIVAHSKGGLDARYAISCMGMDKYVASLTTINTPHKGCAFADYLLRKMPKNMYYFIARKYNSTLKKIGDKNPDFMGAIEDLTEKNCAVINDAATDKDGILYHCVMSKMNAWSSSPFPQNITYLLAKCFCKDSDGLVSVEAAKWGDSFQLVEVNGKRGISHGDMIDLHRHNIDGFDVREFYVDLVRNLKKSGC